MKIALFSDLHLDFWRKVHYSRDLGKLAGACNWATIVMNAGDTFEAPDHAEHPEFLKKSFFANIPYYECWGNHDYYKGEFQNQWFTDEFKGQRIFAATLWTNFNDNPLCELMAERSIADFKQIKGGTVEAMKAAFFDTQKELVKYRPTIVMTHFPPLHECIDKKHGISPLNSYFCNNMKKLLKTQPQIRLWISGHTHSSYDFVLDGCRFVSHQLGYPSENYREFTDYKPMILEI